ncbi:MAG TPA: hypothetical protein VNA28_13770 [Solirubrobacteraceae bacterium]|nr:hypothetical protein [Solirubrobacteraceae bacterium]
MRALDALPRIAELSLEAARQAGSLAISVARLLAEPILGRKPGDSSGSARNWEPPSSRPVAEPPAPPSTPRRSPGTTPAAAPARPPRTAARPRPVPVPEPEHVDRDAVVVAQFADAGAEDGPGAEIRVDEPWDGYSQLKAKDVTDHLATADPATLAVVRLYETSHRNRRTVLAEIDRRLATTGS